MFTHVKRSAFGLVVSALATGALVSGVFAQTANTTLKVGAGVGSGTTAGNVYAPGDVSVHVGDSVTWTINSDEPHTITLGQGPAGAPPPAWPVAGFKAPPPGPPGPVALGSADTDGSAFVNTGLIFKGSTATLHLTKLGDYQFFCVIHPGMAGTVHVVDAGKPVTAQADADAKAAATQTQILGQVDGVAKKTQDAVSSQKNANGKTLWKIFTNGVTTPGPVNGGGTGYLELLQFTPSSLSISAGDSVEWTATAPHSVTFLQPGQDVHALGDPTAIKAAKPSDSYDGKSFYNSGIFLFGPGAPSTFQLTFPTAGDFKYLCVLHSDLGQVGTIHVAASASQPTSLPSTGGSPMLLVGLLSGLGAVMVVSGLLITRSSATR